MVALDLNVPYEPTAIYLHDADIVEYVRADVLTYSRRVDAFLTLIYDFEDRQKLIGFRLKGFKHIYLTDFKDKFERFGDFLALVSVLEALVEKFGESFFSEIERKEAYAKAREIAAEDGVTLRDLPHAA